MRISIREAFNYATKAKGAITAILLLTLITILFQSLQFLLQLAEGLPVVGLALMCLVLPTSFVLSIVFAIFIYGFYLHVADNSRRTLMQVPQLFSDLKQRMLRGLYAYVVAMLYYLPFSVLFVGIIIASLLAVSFAYGDTGSRPDTTMIFVLILLSIFALAILILIGTLTTFLLNAAFYKLLSKNYSISEALKFGEVWKITKTTLADNVSLLLKQFVLSLGFLLVFIILFIPSIVTFVIAQDAGESLSTILLIIGVVLIAIVSLASLVAQNLIQYLMTPHLLGQMYRIWDSKGFHKE